jgi:tripartite-type tricarboxylate transporter receptor subunit TctC
MNTRRGVASGFLAAVLAAVAPASWAQPFPNKPIRLIVPDAPGGAPDILARLLTQKMSEGLGQQVIVDNRPGAAGQLAAEAAARAAPDGYTLFMSTTAVWAILPSAKKSLPYDSTKAFVPITRIATTSNVLVVSPSLPVDSVAELIKLAKASPGNLTYASAGVGSPAHLAGEMLAQLAQTKLTHVPYKGAAPALLDVLGGSVQMMVTSPARSPPAAYSATRRCPTCRPSPSRCRATRSRSHGASPHRPARRRTSSASCMPRSRASWACPMCVNGCKAWASCR